MVGYFIVESVTVNKVITFKIKVAGLLAILLYTT